VQCVAATEVVAVNSAACVG